MEARPGKTTSLLLIAFALLLSFVETLSTVMEEGSGTAASLKLPLYHFSEITKNREEYLLVRAQIQRHLNRNNFIRPIHSGRSTHSGGFLTRIGLGTPSQYRYLLLDTGSNLNWVQCGSCNKCFRQPDRPFDPAKSKSYSKVSCKSRLCQDNAVELELKNGTCKQVKQPCNYKYSYGDNSYSAGELSVETFQAQGTRLGPIAFGCAHEAAVSEGPTVGYSGLLALANGGLSFPSQTKKQFKGKFTYCLNEFESTDKSKHSYLIFGDAPIPRTAQFAPLISTPLIHFTVLKGISVAGKPVPGITPQSFPVAYFDIGAATMSLPEPAYRAVRKAFAAAVNFKRVVTPDDDFCYSLTGDWEKRVPKVVLHLQGADMDLPPRSVLIAPDTLFQPKIEKNQYCIAFDVNEGSNLTSIGFLPQQGFWVQYDVPSGRLGISSGGCAY